MSITVESRHALILGGVRARLEAMKTAGAFTGDTIRDPAIIQRPLPYGKDITAAGGGGAFTFPAIMVVYGPQESIQPSSNVNVDYGYPVLVIIATPMRQPKDGDKAIGDAGFAGDLHSDDVLLWRQRIIADFLPSPANPPKTLGGVATFNTQIEPAPIMDWGQFFESSLFVSVFSLRFFTRVPT